MNDIPGLRLAPARMIALVGQRGRPLDSVSPKSTPAERHAAGSSGPRVLAAKPPELKGPTITDVDTTRAMPTRVARFTSNHSEPTADADDAPEREISFGDFLDVINPLQHIPIVGTIYRAITGDEISPPASIFGGFLFGGPLGFVLAIANAIFEEASGQDLGETALAALLGDDTAADVQTAQTPNANSTTAPLEVATPTQDSQALAAATTTGPTARKADSYSGASESLTDRPALAAFVRDLRETGQLARAAPQSSDLARAEFSGAPALREAGGLQTAALPANRAAGQAAAHGSPSSAMENLPGITQTRADAASQKVPRNIQSLSEPKSGPPRDNLGVLVAIQARAPDAHLVDPRTTGATLPVSIFAARMFDALDKYRAMAREGERNGKDRASVLDTQL